MKISDGTCLSIQFFKKSTLKRDITQLSLKEKNDRAKKMMLWFGLASLLMAFAGWTSAYIVSSAREDWSAALELPTMFYFSTGVIIVSSLTYIMAKKAIESDNVKACTNWLLVTLALGVLFIVLQFNGFSQLISQGHYFTGPTSTHICDRGGAYCTCRSRNYFAFNSFVQSFQKKVFVHRIFGTVARCYFLAFS